MLLSIYNFKLLLPVVFFSLPFYFISKYLERKIKPRESGKQFLMWIIVVLLSAFIYFFVFGTLYVKFIHHSLFSN